jgi:hypothetical protein
MTENKRTLTYIGIALVLIVMAAVVNRKPTIQTDETLEVLFPQLKSPENVAGLEIVTTDAAGDKKELRVMRGDKGWTLPLENDYPADAEKQVGSAASSLIDLKPLAVVSTLPSKHTEYGVVDPEKASPGAEGVGKLVKVLDKSGNNIARLVIGKRDTQAGANLDSSRELYYVRVLPHDAVYRVALPTAKFSTDFADWIETDLLKLDSWDVSKVTLKDYTFDIAADPLSGKAVKNHDQLSTIEVAYNDRDAKWSLEKLIEYENDQPKPVELGPNEELNSVRLNEMKSALDDLKIVGVRPKPAGMSSNLKANKSIFTDRQSILSLAERGFYAVPDANGDPEILSSDGEVLVQMKDGVEYTLRFGGVASVGAEVKSSDSDKAKDGKEAEKKGATLNRFIMVSARFNKDLIPKPELETPPAAAGESKTNSTEKQNGKDNSSQPRAASEAPKPAAPAGETKESAADTKEADAGGENKTEKSKSPDEKKSAASKFEAWHFVAIQDQTPKSEDVKSDDAKSDDGKSGTPKTNAADQDADKAKASPKAKQNETEPAGDAKSNPDSGETKSNPTKSAAKSEEDQALERKRIETENERKQKEYDDKIKKGEARARELNARFADWYYVVSEETYRKIHLNRADVIKPKGDEKTGTGAAPGASNTKALTIPPLSTEKTDPFQKRDEAVSDDANGDSAKADETKAGKGGGRSDSESDEAKTNETKTDTGKSEDPQTEKVDSDGTKAAKE